MSFVPVTAGGGLSGWQFLARQMRPQDTVCIGHHLGDNPNMIAENVATFGAQIG